MKARLRRALQGQAAIDLGNTLALSIVVTRQQRRVVGVSGRGEPVLKSVRKGVYLPR